MSRLLAGALAVSLFGAGAFASGSGTAPALLENPYASVYAKNISGMTKPDQSLDLVMPADAQLAFSSFSEPAAQSKTCSQRCSTTCSNGCTTSRGCSSSCRRQSDGCGGTSTGGITTPMSLTPRAETAPVPPVQTLPTGVPSAVDLSVRSVLNAQRALAIAGYEGFCLDNTYSAGFTASLKDFQSRNSLAAVGVLTTPTWQLLDMILSRRAP